MKEPREPKSTPRNSGSSQPLTRSEIMARIKGKDTKPEKAVRSLLHAMGYRFRLHRRDLPGSPDIVLPCRKTVIFVHGCFWHSHACERDKSAPKTNAEFWARKRTLNAARDIRKSEELEALGWQVLVVWQCELKNVSALEEKLRGILK